jgi:hypothetical protein
LDSAQSKTIISALQTTSVNYEEEASTQTALPPLQNSSTYTKLEIEPEPSSTTVLASTVSVDQAQNQEKLQRLSNSISSATATRPEEVTGNHADANPNPISDKAEAERRIEEKLSKIKYERIRRLNRYAKRGQRSDALFRRTHRRRIQ